MFLVCGVSLTGMTESENEGLTEGVVCVHRGGERVGDVWVGEGMVHPCRPGDGDILKHLPLYDFQPPFLSLFPNTSEAFC